MISVRQVRDILAVGMAFAVAQTQLARAQAVDYGTLEQVFGEPITTSATGKPQRASEVPADMVIITQDDIRRSGATSIPDVLQFVTGIDIRTYSFGDQELAVRGYDQPDNPRLLVLVDGREVYDDFYGNVNWNTIPVQLGEIRQIEVVKGPNSALFGFNAASGVVNIVTFDPLLDKTNTVTLRGGTQGYGDGEGVYTQHFGSVAGVRVSVGGYTATGYSQPQPLQQVPPRYGSFNADGRWQVIPGLLLNASGGYTNAHSLHGVPLEELTDVQQRLSYFRGGGALESRFGTITTDVYRNEDLETLFGGTPKIVSTIAKITDLVQLGTSNTVRTGFEYRNLSIGGVPTQFPGTVSYDNYAVNGMWNWQISPMFNLTNAVRLDHLVLHQSGPIVPTAGRTAADYNNATITQPSFNSGLVIHVTDLDVIRLTAARGLQLPSLLDFALQAAPAPRFYFVGSPESQTEAVWNAEIGYTRSLAPIGASLVTSVFFQRNTQILISPDVAPPVVTSPGLVTSTENIGSSNEIGFEVGLKGTTDGGFRWNASYRYASISQDIFSNLSPAQQTGFANGTPLHAIILGAGYTLGSWEMDAAGRYQTQFTDYAENSSSAVVPVIIPAYVTLNARLGYKVMPWLTVAGVAQQFNVTPLLSGAQSYIDRRFIASITANFWPIASACNEDVVLVRARQRALPGKVALAPAATGVVATIGVGGLHAAGPTCGI